MGQMIALTRPDGGQIAAYSAGSGTTRPEVYDAETAEEAWQRTIRFLKANA